MKHLIGLFLAAVIAVSVVPYARSLGVPAAPPGVIASDWIPLGDAAFAWSFKQSKKLAANQYPVR